MIYIIQNALPILLATLAGLVVGGLYLRIAGLPARGLGFYVTVFIAQAWFAAILAGALILAPPRGGAWLMAIGSAVVIWLGFVVPVTIVSLRARKVDAVATLIECLYWLAVMLVQALVLKSVGLVAPPV